LVASIPRLPAAEVNLPISAGCRVVPAGSVMVALETLQPVSAAKHERGHEPATFIAICIRGGRLPWWIAKQSKNGGTHLG
jgi:hypothetical protein